MITTNKKSYKINCRIKYGYLAESMSLLSDSKSEADLLTPGCIPMLLENSSKIGANC